MPSDNFETSSDWTCRRLSVTNGCMNDAVYFPKNYHDSRKRFFEGLKSLDGIQTEQWSIPSQKDSDLYVDVGYWPALKSQDLLLVVTSGIHGSETYAGSAIQQMLIQETLPHMKRDSVGVLLVHAMNPYGFKHHQRTTENGVNLNRNFSLSGKLFQNENVESRRMHEMFHSYSKVTSLKSKLIESYHIKNGQPHFGDVSIDYFTKAVSRGQFERPDHLEFGGSKLEPQSEMLAEKIRSLMPEYKDVIAIDLHTGLGDANRLHLLTSGSGKDLHPELFSKHFDASADHAFYEYTPATTEGFYEVHGALNGLFVDLASPHNRVCAITAEFGTLGHSLEAQLEGWNSSALRHQGTYYGYASQQLEEQVKRENFLRSYPQSDIWRNAVIGASRGLFQRILSRK